MAFDLLRLQEVFDLLHVLLLDGVVQINDPPHRGLVRHLQRPLGSLCTATTHWRRSLIAHSIDFFIPGPLAATGACPKDPLVVHGRRMTVVGRLSVLLLTAVPSSAEAEKSSAILSPTVEAIAVLSLTVKAEGGQIRQR